MYVYIKQQTSPRDHHRHTLEGWVKGVLQLLINCCGQIRFAQVPERVSTQSFVVVIIGNSKSNH